MTVLMFPGQGAQFKGMGKDLFPAFPDLTQRASALLGYDIEELCTKDPQRVLSQTQFTQPALFVVNALAFHRAERVASYCIGHSLGELDALYAAGAFDFETGLRIVQQRGELIAQALDGGMAAIVGLEHEAIVALLREHGIDLDIANLNSRRQTVVSGRREDIAAAGRVFEGRPDVKSFVPLNVSGAFHSRFMRPARDAFAAFLATQTLSAPRVPVVANLTARPYGADPRALLADQIVSPVRWEESIRWLMGQGQHDYLELGPGKVLTELVARITKESEPLRDVAKPVGITPASLGSDEFRKSYGLKYAYLAGSMYRGTSSKELVVRLARAGLMGFLGTGGLSLERIEADLRWIKSQVDARWGANLLANLHDPELELQTVDLYLRLGVTVVEASAYVEPSLALVRYRVKGLVRNPDGSVSANNRLIAKVSKPAVAEAFMAPIAERALAKLMDRGLLSIDECVLAKGIALCDDVTVEADSAGHTDMGNLAVLLPSIARLRDASNPRIRVGAAGGISTPESAAAAFMLGADYIVTGSINQCTVEAGTSDIVKDLLQDAGPGDTDYCPAGDMFEIGAKVQVLKKGLFFPARAKKLFDLYSNVPSLDALDAKTRDNLEKAYFGKSLEAIWDETRAYFATRDPQQLAKAEKSPKTKMALVFRWYFGMSTRVAFVGDEARKVDMQIHCGPALGAFNAWVKGTRLESWRERHVDDLAEHLMRATADYLGRALARFGG